MFVGNVGLVLGFGMAIMIRVTFAVGIWLRSTAVLMRNLIHRDVRGTGGLVSAFGVTVSDFPNSLRTFVLSFSGYEGWGHFDSLPTPEVVARDDWA